MLAGHRIALSENLEGFHGTEVFDVGRLHVYFDHGWVVAVIEERQELLLGGEEQVTNYLVHLSGKDTRGTGNGGTTLDIVEENYFIPSRFKTVAH